MRATNRKEATGLENLSAPVSLLERSWKSLVIAGLYVIAGLAGLLLPHPPSYATPIWPAAGVAVAALIAWGWRCWPGVWLGSLLIHLWLTPSLSGAGLGVLLGGASALQAALGAWLSRRDMHRARLFAGDRGLALFLLCFAPLTCLVAATLSCSILLAGGRIATEHLLDEWLLWWYGDTMGVLLFAFLLRLFWPGEHPLRIEGGLRFRFALPLIVTTTLLLVGHLGLAQLESLRARSEANKLKEIIADSGSREIADTLFPLEGLAHFIATSQEVTREEFHRYSHSFLNRSAILSVDWAPRVTQAQRSDFEAAVVRAGFPTYRIGEPDSHGRLQPAALRAEYFPVLFSEPRRTAALVLGLDHAAEPLRRQAMEVARQQGAAIASDLVRLLRTERHASLVFIPVWRSSDGSLPQGLLGYVVGVLDIRALFGPLLHKAEEHRFALRITDVTPGLPQRTLVDSLPADARTDWSHDFAIGGRTWRLELEPSTPLWQPGATTEERLFLAFAMLTALIAVFASVSSARRHAEVTCQVTERTAQLQRSAQQLNRLNAELEQRIEERGQALADLHAKEAELRAVLDHLLDCVITIDNRGIVQSVTAAIEPLLGYRAQELVGRPFRALLSTAPPAERDCAPLHDLLDGQGQLIGSSRELSGRHKDGHAIDLELSVSEYQVHGERCFIGTLRDIRERKALIASLTQAREDAEQASRAKSAFLAAMSHEIRTPMNGVVGLIDVLAQDRLPPHQADLIKTVRESSSNLLGVIDDILDFSKIEAGKLEIECEPLPLVELIDNLCSTLRPMASMRGVTLAAEIAADVPPWVSSDAMRLRQILFNLIGNAIKFSGGRSECAGRVALRAHLAEGDPLRLVIVVEDNGIGIAAEHLDQLFCPFTQAESSTTRRFGGSGLGLAICQRLVELLSGEIRVASSPGRGTLFTVTLPLTIASAPPGSESAPHPDAEQLALPCSAPEALSSRRILVVEDDAVNRKVIQQQLALLGYGFAMANHGAEALAMWREGDYDLVLSDLHMPEMDGYQLASRIRDEEAGQRRIPILALTANAMRGEAVRAHEAGMDEYLTKPIRLAALQATLARWLPLQTTATPDPAPLAAPAPDTPALVDPQALIALVGEDREMIREILGDYAEALRALAPRLQTAFAHNDSDVIDALAHRLKSSSRAVGALRLSELCAALEQAVQDGDSTALARGIAEFAPLHGATAARIDQLLAAASPA